MRKKLAKMEEANPLCIDFSAPFISKFIFHDKSIMYKGDNNAWTQVFQVRVLSRTEKTVFLVRIE